MNSGTKETKEALAGALAVGILFYKKFADGIQTQDFMEIFAKFQLDEAFKAKVVEMYNGANLISSELTDLTLSEGLDLAIFGMGEVNRAIQELKA
jgi:hypothetical protein